MRTAYRVAASTGLAFLVLALLVVTEWSPLMELDHDVVGPATDLARDHATYRGVIKTVTWLLHSQLVLLYAVVLAIALALGRRPGAAVWLSGVVALGTELNFVLKQVVDRDRPAVTDPVGTFSGLSFPSGHASSAALICAAVVVVFWPGLGPTGRVLATVVAVGVPLLSCWTRMTLGAHYLSDVVGGVLLGVAWVAVWQPALPTLERMLSARTPPRR